MRQPRDLAEHDVGGPFALVGGPVVLHREAGKHRGMLRVQAARDAVQQCRPVGAHLAVHHSLGPVRVLQPGEAVVPPLVAQPGGIHAACQPLPAVQADLDAEREPGLDARVHEAEARMDLIVVEIQAASKRCATTTLSGSAGL